MKNETNATGMHPNLRGGVISVLVLAIGYLAMTGISDLPRAWAFMLMFAVCFVLMMKSVVDLLVRAFGVGVRYAGMGIGHSVRFLNRVF